MSNYFEIFQKAEEEFGIIIVSWGLAPNPAGYCYEMPEKSEYETPSQDFMNALDEACDLAPRGYL